MPSPSPADFGTVIGILRLAHKYDVQYLFRRALSHLDFMYPMNFHAFEAVNNRNPRDAAVHYVENASGIRPHLITLRVASQVGATWLLPTAYYSVCTYSSFFEAGKDWIALGPEAQQTCLNSQIELAEGTAMTYMFVDETGKDCSVCSSSEDCATLVRDALAHLGQSAAAEADLNPLGEWLFSDLICSLCRDCGLAALNYHTCGQLDFWKRMPGIFGLPEWEELIKMKELAES
jgi:hypothetical protein